MEKKTALLCDSSADVTEEEAKELGIHVLRMPVIIEGKEYLEGVSVFDSDILEALREEDHHHPAKRRRDHAQVGRTAAGS